MLEDHCILPAIMGNDLDKTHQQSARCRASNFRQPKFHHYHLISCVSIVRVWSWDSTSNMMQTRKQWIQSDLGSKNGTLTLKTGHTLVLLFGSTWRPETWSRHAAVPSWRTCSTTVQSLFSHYVPSSKSRSLEARLPKLPKLERNPGSCNVGPPAMFVGFPIDKSI